MDSEPLQLRRLGRRPYVPVWEAMRAHTAARGSETPDALWLVEHEPVYTLGRNAATEHLLDAGEIPVVAVDRGGQITYHGPGQVLAYVLLDLRRRGWAVRGLVEALEQGVIDLLAEHEVVGARRPGAPGVYVDGAKVAALGLRVRRGCTYHGLALNVDMDLAPFARINPCGFVGLPVTQLSALGVRLDAEAAASSLARHLRRRLDRPTFRGAAAPAGTEIPTMEADPR
ncbi:MAG: lipoyl(octanoyl) transferase LipB [Gammaproteobacteria bacterium]|nr:lipoyl(octanoyl) transferase LipB [Gammaproteobacteria bacterium]